MDECINVQVFEQLILPQLKNMELKAWRYEMQFIFIGNERISIMLTVSKEWKKLTET